MLVAAAMPTALLGDCAAGWVPQRTVEEQFRQHNPWLMSAYHLWPYLVGSTLACAAVVLLLPRGYMALAVILAALLLPAFTAITTIPVAWYSKQSKRMATDSMRELRCCMPLACFGLEPHGRKQEQQQLPQGPAGGHGRQRTDPVRPWHQAAD
jgi:hypothetical protein